MITPRLFSHPMVEQFLPEVVGERHRDLRLSIATEQKHRCAISGYPYPPLKPAPGRNKGSTHLVLDLPIRDDAGKPINPTQAAKVLKAQGPSSKTLIAVCPLVFWSQHVDLAAKYGRGDVVFTPGLSQFEINTVFRSLLVAVCKGDQQAVSATLSGDAGAVLQAFDMTFGRHEILREAMCLPETVDWDTQIFLSTVQGMPERERTLYLRRFVSHLRFWPSRDAFFSLGRYWGAVSHKTSEPVGAESLSWPEQYENLLKRVAAASESTVAPA